MLDKFMTLLMSMNVPHSFTKRTDSEGRTESWVTLEVDGCEVYFYFDGNSEFDTITSNIQETIHEKTR